MIRREGNAITVSVSTGSVATPVLSPNGGTFTSTQTVTLSTTTSGATIRYTLDGSEPTATSPSGTAVAISSSGTLKARAFASGMTDNAGDI